MIYRKGEIIPVEAFPEISQAAQRERESLRSVNEKERRQMNIPAITERVQAEMKVLKQQAETGEQCK